MSSIAGDMVNEHAATAMTIQGFLWEGKPHKSKKIERTKEELEEFLESVRKTCWSNYDAGASDLGWRE
jgi:hypothetical protein